MRAGPPEGLGLQEGLSLRGSLQALLMAFMAGFPDSPHALRPPSGRLTRLGVPGTSVRGQPLRPLGDCPGPVPEAGAAVGKRGGLVRRREDCGGDQLGC